MKEKIKVLSIFKRSFYDIDIFADLAKQGLKKSIIYLILLSCIVGCVKGFVFGYRFYDVVANVSNVFNNSEYNIYIENGILNADKAPIKVEKGNKFILYIDDKNSIDDKINFNNPQIDKEVSLFMLKDGIVGMTSDEYYKVYYKELFSVSMDNQIIKTAMDNINIMYLIFIIIANIINSLINLVVNYIIIVTILSIITIFMRMMVKYKALWSISIYASTLPLFIVTVLGIINPYVNLDTAFIVGTVIYLILILVHIKKGIIEKILNKNS